MFCCLIIQALTSVYPKCTEGPLCRCLGSYWNSVFRSRLRIFIRLVSRTFFSDRHTGYPLFETWKHLHRCCWNSRYCGCFIRKHSHHHSFTFLSHHYLLVFITDIDRDESLEQSNRRWRSRTSCECFKIDYGNLHSFYNWIRFFKSFVHRNSSLWTYEKIELDLLVYYIWQMP